MKFEDYVVMSNETLNNIGRKFNISGEELTKYNNFDPNVMLQTGTVIKIPVSESSAFTFYEIKPGDTIFSLANRYNLEPVILLAINGLDPQDYLYPGQYIIVPKEGVILYLTVPGDSLQSVADKYQTLPEDVIVYNSNIYLLPEQIIAYKQV